MMLIFVAKTDMMMIIITMNVVMMIITNLTLMLIKTTMTATGKVRLTLGGEGAAEGAAANTGNLCK